MKFSRLYLVVLLLVIGFSTKAQDTVLIKPSNGIRISFLTCGPGLELYSGFGHSGIRVIDSTIPSDAVYNYGTFDFNAPNFYSKFTRGKLLYYVNEESFREFIYTYQVEKRFVYEQVLALNDEEENKLLAYLDSNALEENRYYKYDFLYDNCTTRQLEICKDLFGEKFIIGTAIEPYSKTFRDFTDHYLRNNHWTRFGIDLLLSTPVDKKMSNEQAMFLPDYLMEGMRDATLNGKPIVAQTIEILPERLDFSPTTNMPYYILWSFLFFVIIFKYAKIKKPFTYRNNALNIGMIFALFLILRILAFFQRTTMMADLPPLYFWVIVLLTFVIAALINGKNRMVYFDTFFFLTLGLLGCFMLFMWFGTDHQSCSWNRNLLWALPTHIVFAFLIPRNHKWVQQYAKVAFYILLAAIVWNLWAAQTYMVELTPIVLLLIWRLNHYRRDPEKNQKYENIRTIFSQFRQARNGR